ncbi:unnamed protein product [Plasmodium vivax]|uniref:(malaria parasite P. vivax) hypothetical protein n=1 Tax=Plasmodium vivax TaxID=5855 RepID=A0A8S4H627_PLAVI|nr:unnamed protein product [Plasmodium vivax]
MEVPLRCELLRRELMAAGEMLHDDSNGQPEGGSLPTMNQCGAEKNAASVEAYHLCEAATKGKLTEKKLTQKNLTQKKQIVVMRKWMLKAPNRSVHKKTKLFWKTKKKKIPIKWGQRKVLYCEQNDGEGARTPLREAGGHKKGFALYWVPETGWSSTPCVVCSLGKSTCHLGREVTTLVLPPREGEAQAKRRANNRISSDGGSTSIALEGRRCAMRRWKEHPHGFLLRRWKEHPHGFLLRRWKEHPQRFLLRRWKNHPHGFLLRRWKEQPQRFLLRRWKNHPHGFLLRRWKEQPQRFLLRRWKEHPHGFLLRRWKEQPQRFLLRRWKNHPHNFPLRRCKEHPYTFLIGRLLRGDNTHCILAKMSRGQVTLSLSVRIISPFKALHLPDDDDVLLFFHCERRMTSRSKSGSGDKPCEEGMHLVRGKQTNKKKKRRKEEKKKKKKSHFSAGKLHLCQAHVILRATHGAGVCHPRAREASRRGPSAAPAGEQSQVEQVQQAEQAEGLQAQQPREGLQAKQPRPERTDWRSRVKRKVTSTRYVAQLACPCSPRLSRGSKRAAWCVETPSCPHVICATKMHMQPNDAPIDSRKGKKLPVRAPLPPQPLQLVQPPLPLQPLLPVGVPLNPWEPRGGNDSRAIYTNFRKALSGLLTRSDEADDALSCLSLLLRLFALRAYKTGAVDPIGITLSRCRDSCLNPRSICVVLIGKGVQTRRGEKHSPHSHRISGGTPHPTLCLTTGKEETQNSLAKLLSNPKGCNKNRFVAHRDVSLSFGGYEIPSHQTAKKENQIAEEPLQCDRNVPHLEHQMWVVKRGAHLFYFPPTGGSAPTISESGGDNPAASETRSGCGEYASAQKNKAARADYRRAGSHGKRANRMANRHHHEQKRNQRQHQQQRKKGDGANPQERPTQPWSSLNHTCKNGSEKKHTHKINLCEEDYTQGGTREGFHNERNTGEDPPEVGAMRIGKKDLPSGHPYEKRAFQMRRPNCLCNAKYAGEHPSGGISPPLEEETDRIRHTREDANREGGPPGEGSNPPYDEVHPGEFLFGGGSGSNGLNRLTNLHKRYDGVDCATPLATHPGEGQNVECFPKGVRAIKRSSAYGREESKKRNPPKWSDPRDSPPNEHPHKKKKKLSPFCTTKCEDKAEGSSLVGGDSPNGFAPSHGDEGNDLAAIPSSYVERDPLRMAKPSGGVFATPTLFDRSSLDEPNRSAAPPVEGATYEWFELATGTPAGKPRFDESSSDEDSLIGENIPRGAAHWVGSIPKGCNYPSKRYVHPPERHPYLWNVWPANRMEVALSGGGTPDGEGAVEQRGSGSDSGGDSGSDGTTVANAREGGQQEKKKEKKNSDSNNRSNRNRSDGDDEAASQAGSSLSDGDSGADLEVAVMERHSSILVNRGIRTKKCVDYSLYNTYAKSSFLQCAEQADNHFIGNYLDRYNDENFQHLRQKVKLCLSRTFANLKTTSETCVLHFTNLIFDLYISRFNSKDEIIESIINDIVTEEKQFSDVMIQLLKEFYPKVYSDFVFKEQLKGKYNILYKELKDSCDLIYHFVAIICLFISQKYYNYRLISIDLIAKTYCKSHLEGLRKVYSRNNELIKDASPDYYSATQYLDATFCAHSVNKNFALEVEICILKKLNYDLSIPTPYSLLDSLLKANENINFLKLKNDYNATEGEILLRIASIDNTFLKYKSSTLSMAIYEILNFNICKDKMQKELFHFTNFQADFGLEAVGGKLAVDTVDTVETVSTPTAANAASAANLANDACRTSPRGGAAEQKKKQELKLLKRQARSLVIAEEEDRFITASKYINQKALLYQCVKRTLICVCAAIKKRVPRYYYDSDLDRTDGLKGYIRSFHNGKRGYLDRLRQKRQAVKGGAVNERAANEKAVKGEAAMERTATGEAKADPSNEETPESATVSADAATTAATTAITAESASPPSGKKRKRAEGAKAADDEAADDERKDQDKFQNAKKKIKKKIKKMIKKLNALRWEDIPIQYCTPYLLQGEEIKIYLKKDDEEVADRDGKNAQNGSSGRKNSLSGSKGGSKKNYVIGTRTNSTDEHLVFYYNYLSKLRSRLVEGMKYFLRRIKRIKNRHVCVSMVNLSYLLNKKGLRKKRKKERKKKNIPLYKQLTNEIKIFFMWLYKLTNIEIRPLIRFADLKYIACIKCYERSYAKYVARALGGGAKREGGEAEGGKHTSTKHGSSKHRSSKHGSSKQRSSKHRSSKHRSSKHTSPKGGAPKRSRRSSLEKKYAQEVSQFAEAENKKFYPYLKRSSSMADLTGGHCTGKVNRKGAARKSGKEAKSKCSKKEGLVQNKTNFYEQASQNAKSEECEMASWKKKKKKKNEQGDEGDQGDAGDQCDEGDDPVECPAANELDMQSTLDDFLLRKKEYESLEKEKPFREEQLDGHPGQVFAMPLQDNATKISSDWITINDPQVDECAKELMECFLKWKNKNYISKNWTFNEYPNCKEYYFSLVFGDLKSSETMKGIIEMMHMKYNHLLNIYKEINVQADCMEYD